MKTLHFLEMNTEMCSGDMTCRGFALEYFSKGKGTERKWCKILIITDGDEHMGTYLTIAHLKIS